MGSPEEKKAFRRKLVGTVRSTKMDKTVVVEVVRRFAEKKYRKYIRERKRYQAHDPNNEFWVGDRVEIQEPELHYYRTTLLDGDALEDLLETEEVRRRVLKSAHEGLDQVVEG